MTAELATLALVLGIVAFWLIGGAVALVRYLRRNARNAPKRAQEREIDI